MSHEIKYSQILNDVKGLPFSYKEKLLSDLNKLIVAESIKVNSPASIYEKCLSKYKSKKQEYFIVVFLDGGNKIMKTHVATIGLLNSSQVHPREVFSEAVKRQCASVIIAHNHPSGNNEPSQEGRKVTGILKKAGDIIGIPVLDHLIFSKTGYYSMLENGDFN